MKKKDIIQNQQLNPGVYLKKEIFLQQIPAIIYQRLWYIKKI